MAPSNPSSTAHTGTDSQPGPSRFAGRPDDLFALAVGLYVALTVVPLGTGLATTTVSDAATLYLSFLAGITVVTAGVALAVRHVPGLDRRLGATRVRWGLVVVPLGVVAAVGGGQAVVFAGGPSNVAVVLGVVAAFGGFLAGAVLAMMAGTRYARAVAETTETLAEWRAGWPQTRQRRMQVVGVGLAVVGIFLFVADPLLHVPYVRALGHLFVPLGAVVMFGQSRGYRVSTAGLEQRAPANRNLYEWSRFEGYAVADDAIVVYFRAPWRFPIVCDRSDVDDEDLVVAVLDEYLPCVTA